MLEHTDFFAVVVGRRDVEAGNLRPTLAMLGELLSTPQTIRRFRERVEIKFEGYDHHPEELWEIPNVRNFVHALDAEFPYWLYFLTREGTGLECLARCFLLPFLTPEAERKHHPPALQQVLVSRWFPALNAAAAAAGLKEQDVQELSESALTYLLGPPAQGTWT